MQVKLVFLDWKDNDGFSVYRTRPYLTDGQFHSGTTFSGAIDISDADAAALTNALKEGNTPVFEILLP